MKLDDLSVTFGLEMLTSDEREDRGKVSTVQQPPQPRPSGDNPTVGSAKLYLFLSIPEKKFVL